MLCAYARIQKVDTVNGIGCSVVHKVLGFVDEIAHILQLHIFAPARSSHAYVHKGAFGAVTIFYAEGECYAAISSSVAGMANHPTKEQVVY